MKYIVMEIQKSSEGVLSNFVWAYDDFNTALNKYYTVLAAAAGYALPTAITGKNFSEQGKIAVMFGFMCIAIIIVLLFSKKTKKSDTNHPYITAISVNK